MMTMVDRFFCDTNVILRAYHNAFPQYVTVKATFDNLLENGSELWISRQVIREYLVHLTHPRTFETPFSAEKAIQQVRNVLKICSVADETHMTTRILLTLIRDYPVSGKQIHDANIVATMLANGIDNVLTLNAADFNRYADKIRVIVPRSDNS